MSSMKTFIVLGMHRSATSLIAKGLYDNEVSIGDKLIGPHPSNPYGHWEDIDFVRLNDEILSASGGSWDKPPEEKSIIEVSSLFEGKIEKLIKEKQKEPFWGWKDPRTTLTIRLYLKYLEDPHFIVCFRDPAEVARSLARRDKWITRGRALELARIYNERLLRFLQEWTSGKYQL